MPLRVPTRHRAGPVRTCTHTGWSWQRRVPHPAAPEEQRLPKSNARAVPQKLSRYQMTLGLKGPIMRNWRRKAESNGENQSISRMKQQRAQRDGAGWDAGKQGAQFARQAALRRKPRRELGPRFSLQRRCNHHVRQRCYPDAATTIETAVRPKRTGKDRRQGGPIVSTADHVCNTFELAHRIRRHRNHTTCNCYNAAGRHPTRAECANMSKT